MHYPYERFLRFLVSRKVDVDQTLGRYGLPAAGPLWVATCRAQIRASAPSSVTEYLDADDDSALVDKDGFLEWADEQGFRALWDIQKEFGGSAPDETLDTAFQIFVNPFARSVVGMMLLSQATSEEVAELTRGRFDLGVDESTLKLYTTIFWDGDLLGRTGWNDFIGELKTKEERHYLALGLSSPTTEEVRQFLEINTCFAPEDILERIMRKAHSEFESAMQQPNPEAMGALKWADLALRAINTLSNTKKTFSPGDDSIPTGDYSQMFSVQVQRIEHVSLSEIQGETSPLDKNEAPEED